MDVEVVVTDRDGARVRGLGPEDFALTVDGDAVPIEFFTEVVGGVGGRGGDHVRRHAAAARPAASRSA